MKILMLLDEEFPPDNRVEKEAFSLIEAGHEVAIACYTLEGRAAYEEYRGIKIYRLPLSRLEYKLSAACLVVPWHFSKWRRFASKLFAENHYDIVHVHDLPLTSVGYFLKKKFKIKLVSDQHEFYSNWIVHTAHYNTFLGKIVKFLSPWKKYEKKYLRKSDLVLTIEEPLREIYISQVGVKPDKVYCLPNTPSIDIFSQKNFDEKIIDSLKKHFVLFYAGGIDILRGIDVAIKALPHIISEIPNVQVVLCGKIMKPYDPIRLATDLGVSEYINFQGWAPIEKLPSYIQASEMCFFTPPSNREEIHRTIATKIYQYLQYGKPVIVGRARMMKDFVEEYQIGYTINENEPEEFAERVIHYYKNYESESKRIRKSCNLIRDRFVWEETVKVLTDQYERLVNT